MLSEIGFDTNTIAGDGDADFLIPNLSIGATEPPNPQDISSVLQNSDLVIVENLGTIPLNLEASLITLKVLSGRPAIMHHHDPPWQRVHFGHITDLPIDDSEWRHVVINDFTKNQMKERGITATRIYNPIDIEAPKGNRQETRKILGVKTQDILCSHPARAIRLKNIAEAISITEKLGGTYWLVGSAEENYENTMRQILKNAQCKVIPPSYSDKHISSNNIYAASDIIVFPSHWESFGLPPLEAAVYGIPAIVGDYPVAEEIRKIGFSWFYPWETEKIIEFLQNPDKKLLEHNLQILKTHFSLDIIKQQIVTLLDEAGWLP